MNELYPVTVFSARYGGTYEGAPWVAVQAHADPNVQPRWRVHGDVDLAGCQDDDVVCVRWFTLMHEENVPIGRGSSPDEAVTDLARQLGIWWEPGDDGLMKRFERALEEAHAEKQQKGIEG